MKSPKTFRRSPSGRLDSRENFERFYEETAKQVLGFFRKRVGDDQTSLDLTAETYAQAYECRSRFRGLTQEEAKAWLFGIARNLLSHHIRDGATARRALAKYDISVPTATDHAPEVLESIAAAELGHDVNVHLGRLSADQKEAVHMRVVDELAFSEIAVQLDISEKAARMRVSRGLHQLRRSMTKHRSYNQG